MSNDRQLQKYRHNCTEYSDANRALYQLDAFRFEDGALSRMQKELMALGIAVSRGCEGCVRQHTEAALAAGASREQIAEAAGVAVETTGSPALTYAKLANNIASDRLSA